jgi:sugar lactone lactonase YvrE
MRKILTVMLVMLGMGLAADSSLNLGIISAYQRNLGALQAKINSAKPIKTTMPTLTATPSTTQTATNTATPAATATSSSTVTPSYAATASATQTPTSTMTPTQTGTSTGSMTATETATPTASATQTPTSTATPTLTGTSTGSMTATETATPTASATPTPTSTFTATSTVTVLAAGLANGPTGICVDRNDIVYWVDSVSDTVYSFNIANKAAQLAFGGNAAVSLWNIVVDGSENFYTMQRPSTGGTGTICKNSTPLNIMGFAPEPFDGLCLDALGDSLYSNTNVTVGVQPAQIGTAYLTYLLQDGSSVAGVAFESHNGGVCVDASGNVYASDIPQNRVIQILMPSKAASVFNASPVASPMGLAVDLNGNVYAASALGSVFKIAPNGAVSTIISGYGALSGICFDSNTNSLYVADTGDKQVLGIFLQ